MATLAELAPFGLSGFEFGPFTNEELAGAVARVGALPMPQGHVRPADGDSARIALIRRSRTHCEAVRGESEDDRPPHYWGPSQYPGQSMCQRCTVLREWAEDPDADTVVLLAEIDRVRGERDEFCDRVDTLSAVALSNQRSARVLAEECQRLERQLAEVRLVDPDARARAAELVGLKASAPVADGGACTECGQPPAKWCPDCAACQKGCHGGHVDNPCAHPDAPWGGGRS